MLVPITIPTTQNTRHVHGMTHVNNATRSHFGSRQRYLFTDKKTQSNVFDTKGYVHAKHLCSV